MKRHGLILGITVLALTAGCADSLEDKDVVECTAVCESNQVCMGASCYDTCSLNKACPNANMACINNLCITQDSVCDPETRRCSEDGLSVLVCRDGTGYTFERACGEDQSCEKGACVVNACEEGTKRCRNNNVEQCHNRTFRVYSECEMPQRCSEVSFTCETPVECSGSVKRCDANGGIQICRDGHWESEKKCPSDQACDTALLECVDTAACLAGGKKCIDNAAYSCIDSKWKLNRMCPEGTLCEDGDCIQAECEDGQMHCFEASNGVHYVQECQDHEYANIESCLQNHVCVMQDDVAECVKNECTSAFSCENNILYQCSGAEYVEHKRCGEGTTCSASKADCVADCGNGVLDPSEECDGTLFREGLSCASERPGTNGDLKCTNECILDFSGCVEHCKDGETSCNGQTYSYCEHETWKTTVCKETEQCSSKGCYTSHVPGDWAYTQGFESLEKISRTYATPNTIDDADGKWNIVARTDPKEPGTGGQSDTYYQIEGNVSLIFKGEATSLTITSIPRKIKSFGFSWRSWGNDKDNGTLNIKVDNTIAGTVTFDKSQTEIDNATIEINKAPKTIELELNSGKDGRIIIDNVRWTYDN